MTDEKALRCMLAGALWMRYQDIIEDIMSGAERANAEISTVDQFDLLNAVTWIDSLTPAFEKCVARAVPQAVGLVSGANSSVKEAVAFMTGTSPLQERLSFAGQKLTQASHDIDMLAEMTASYMQSGGPL